MVSGEPGAVLVMVSCPPVLPGAVGAENVTPTWQLPPAGTPAVHALLAMVKPAPEATMLEIVVGALPAFRSVNTTVALVVPASAIIVSVGWSGASCGDGTAT